MFSNNIKADLSSIEYVLLDFKGIDCWAEEIAPDDIYCGQFPYEVYRSRFEFSDDVIDKKMWHRVCIEGNCKGRSKYKVALYCRDHPEAVCLRSQILLNYRFKNNLDLWHGFMTYAILYSKVNMAVRFLRKICLLQHNIYGLPNYWEGNEANQISPKPWVDDFEGANNILAAFMFNKGNQKEKLYESDHEPLKEFILNPDLAHPLYDLRHEDLMEWCWNGFEIKKGILPTMTIKGGYVFSDCYVDLAAFIQEIELVSKSEIIYSYFFF